MPYEGYIDTTDVDVSCSSSSQLEIVQIPIGDNIAKRPFTNMSVPKNGTKLTKSV